MQLYEGRQETTRSRAQSIAKILKVAASRVTFNIKAITAFLVCFLGFVPSVFATTYYINSEFGDDSSTGKQPVASGSSKDGPWQTLGKLASTSLLPGDIVYLACGSVWNETLRIASSGTAAAPIVISAGPGQCDIRPTIDGAVTIPGHMWKQHTGSIYRLRLPVENISNPSFSEGLRGWSVWSTRNDASISLDSNCNGINSPCMAFTSGVDGGIAISNNFPLRAGVSYSVGVRIKARAGTQLKFVVRRGGSTYESLTPDQYLTASGAWQTINYTFRAARSASNARFDIQDISGNTMINVQEAHVQQILTLNGLNEVFVDGGAIRKAHHPNFGHITTDPDSPYAAVAATSGTTILDATGLSLPDNGALTPGLNVSIRTAPWRLEERRITSASGYQLTLDKPTTYSIKQGYGYFLTGALWMVDSPGEWYFDFSTGDLYIWMPDSTAPGNRVSVNSLSAGVDLSAKAYIDVAGLAIRHPTTGARLNRAKAVRLKNMVLSELGDEGVQADYSSSCTVEGSTITDTGLEAIRALGGATGFSISDSNILNSGGEVRTDGWRRLTRGPFKGAIHVSDNARILRNQVLNSAHNGVFVGVNSIVQDNYFGNSCLRYNDCGGIYTGYYGSNSSIIGNVVDTVVGDLKGLPASESRNHTVGIYLDDLGTGLDVRKNTITNAEYGIQIHNAHLSTVAENLLFGNRRYQLWIQEQTAKFRENGDVFENKIESNIFVPIEGGPSVLMESIIGDTGDFATFLNNHYSGLISSRPISESWPSGSASYSIEDWLAKGQDAGARITRPTGYASFLSNGSNIVPNASFVNGSAGWTWWTLTASRPQAAILSCGFGPCLQLTANTAPASLSSPNFSVAGEQWYRVSFDAATSNEDQSINVIVRRGGGGSASYELLMSGPESFLIGTNWRRYSFLFRATKSVTANDPETGELGARIDFLGVQPGTSLTVGRVELVPLQQAKSALQLRLRLNRSSQQELVSCLSEDEAADLCGRFVYLGSDAIVDWTSPVDPLSGQAIYTRDTSLLDADGDGVASMEDACANTQQNRAVNAQGCSFDD